MADTAKYGGCITDMETMDFVATENGKKVLSDEPYLSNRSYLHVCKQHHTSSILPHRMGIVFYCRRNMGERMEAMTDD